MTGAGARKRIYMRERVHGAYTGSPESQDEGPLHKERTEVL
jgi:hypothetical protein